jgi:hypothetical protein
MQISKSIASALQKITPEAGDKGCGIPNPTPDPAPTGKAELQPKGETLMSAAQKVVSAAGAQGSEQVPESTPDQPPTRQAESFQERYNQDRFE